MNITMSLLITFKLSKTLSKFFPIGFLKKFKDMKSNFNLTIFFI